MKSIFNVWVLLGLYISLITAENNYNPEYLSQEVEHHPDSREHQPTNSYEHKSHDDSHSGDPKHYQNLEIRHYQPKAYSTQYFRQYHDGLHQEPQNSAKPLQHYGTQEHVQYNQPEDPSYHKPQELVPHQTPEHYGTLEHVPYNQPEDPSYHRPQELVHHQTPEHYQEDTPRHEKSDHGSSDYHQPELPKEDDSHYKTEEPKYTQTPRHSAPAHRGLVRTDPKLPLYFTMYEKRTIQDPLTKYGKGPWRYLTYGHGISYGTKGPGKVFEKGYGYIRALGRDHCKLPEHLCPPRDEKPFEYEGRKEPYFGYRPH